MPWISRRVSRVRADIPNCRSTSSVEYSSTQRAVFRVAAGAPRLLQIVLERSRDVGVDHQTHIRLVYAHAESVGGGRSPGAHRR